MRRGITVGLLIVLGGACGRPAWAARSDDPPAAASGAGAAPAASESGVDLAAAELVRLAMLDLRLDDVVDASDYAITAQVLEAALSLTPDDLDIVRLLIRAHDAAGNRDRVLELTRRVVEADPSDTVAQLRLLSAAVAQHQDADERLARYERLIGPGYDWVDASVRSRLALDAALLYRETGNIEGFTSMLRAALELDETNKDAASLLVTYATPAAVTSRDRFDLLLVLLGADPLDADTHLAVARELGSAGAYTGAKRFYENHRRLSQTRGVRPTNAVTGEYQAVEWAVNGAEGVLTGLKSELDLLRQRAVDQIRELQAANQPLDRATNPDAVQLNPDLQRVVVAAASGLGDEGRVRWGLDEIDRSVRMSRAVIDQARKAGTAPAETIERAEEAYSASSAELAWLRVWTGVQVDEAAAQIESIKTVAGVNADSLARLEGWLAVRRGEWDRARELLEPRAEQDPRSGLGLVVMAEARGELDAAAAGYTAHWRRMPGTLAGLWARERARLLTGRTPDPSAECVELESAARAVPSWLERLIEDPRRMMTLRAEIGAPQLSLFDRSFVTIRIKNISPIPLALGPEKPINSRLLLVPRVDLGADKLRQGVFPEVFSLDRRLRLMPHEEVSIRAWVDGGYSGWFLCQLAGRAARVRWRVLQGFSLAEDGTYAAGPFCLSTETEAQFRSVLPDARFELPILLKQLEHGNNRDLARTLAALRWQVALAVEGGAKVDEETASGLSGALLRRYVNCDRIGRTLMLAMVPAGGRFPPLAGFDAAAEQEESDPLVQLAALISRANRPDSPVITRLLGSADPSIAALAAQYQEKLRAGAMTYSQLRSSGPQPDQAPALPADANAAPAGTSRNSGGPGGG